MILNVITVTASHLLFSSALNSTNFIHSQISMQMTGTAHIDFLPRSLIAITAYSPPLFLLALILFVHHFSHWFIFPPSILKKIKCVFHTVAESRLHIIINIAEFQHKNKQIRPCLRRKTLLHLRRLRSLYRKRCNERSHKASRWHYAYQRGQGFGKCYRIGSKTFPHKSTNAVCPL